MNWIETRTRVKKIEQFLGVDQLKKYPISSLFDERLHAAIFSHLEHSIASKA